MAVDTAGFPPHLFLIGAQKAGTTSLAYLLDQHPDIAVSNPKEPGFFGAEYARGLDWYRQCFPEKLPQVLLDASTGYTMASIDGAPIRKPSVGGGQAGNSAVPAEPDDTVPRRIKEHSPNARFVYILRDPVERTISAYWHDRRAGRSLGPLREAVSAQPFYADVSRYHRQIELYFAHFPRDRFLFINFAELSADPLGVARRCIAFAGLDPGKATLNLGEPKNAAFQFNPAGRFFFSLFPDERWASRFVGAVKGLTPPAIHRLAKSAMTRAPDTIAEADKIWLSDLFWAENRLMESVANFRFYR